MERRWSDAWTCLTTTHPALTQAPPGDIQIPGDARLCPAHTRHCNCFTELQALPCALGVQLTPSNPTTKPSGASKPLTAVGFNLSLWRMTMSLKESAYRTPFQQTPW